MIRSRCWVCGKQARGFGHLDLHRPKQPPPWAFCSKRCQDVFHQVYGAWFKEHHHQQEAAFMPERNPNPNFPMLLKAFGQAAEQVGFDKPLGSYSKEEAVMVIQAIIDAYLASVNLPFDDILPF